MRRPGRWIVAAIVLVIAASIVRSIVTNPHFQWHVVGQYLFTSRVLHGVLVTLELTVLSMIIGIILGVTSSPSCASRPIRSCRARAGSTSGSSEAHRSSSRSYFWYNIIVALPEDRSGSSRSGRSLIHANANTIITPLVAALLGLGLNEGAYMAEIVRAGILSVGEGQSEAASSLGMSRLQTMRFVVLPQAMRVILPPTGNETISMLKNTSLVSVIAYTELLYSVQQIYDVTYQTIPLLIVAAIWYLAMTSVAYVGQYFIERRFGRGLLPR